MNFCTLILMYGDYSWIHRRCLDSILSTTSDPVVVWANVVGDETRKYLNSIPRVKVLWSNQNVPKYIAMGRLFDLDIVKNSDFFAWFDDDSYVMDEDWMTKAKTHLEKFSPDLSGLTMNSIACGDDIDFIIKAPWYKGVPLTQINDSPVISFVAGGFWLGKTKAMIELDWPDSRLQHKYGDTMLGAAIHQNGMRMSQFATGIEINSSPTRGELVS